MEHHPAMLGVPSFWSTSIISQYLSNFFFVRFFTRIPAWVDWIMVQVSTNSTACHFDTVLKQGSRPARKLALLELPHMSLDTHPPAQRLSRYFTRPQQSGGAGGMWPCRLLLAQMRCDVNFLHELRPNLTSKFKLEAVVHVPQKAG